MANEHFFAPEEISRDGITLRCYRREDAAALSEATNSSYEHLRPWMPWATSDQTLEQSEALCRRFQGSYLLNKEFVLGIWLGDELAGGTGFHLRGTTLDLKIADIGMWIRTSRAGQGLGSSVLHMLVDWGFHDWGWERLTWHCDSRNVASARTAVKGGLSLEGVLRSAGLDMEGRRRDTQLFAIVRSDWAMHNAGAAA